jgi:uncharacterized protein (DUF2164 family)
MAVELADETRKHALASLKRYCNDDLDVEVTDLQAIALLDFMLKEIAPSVYNAAVADAQTFLRDRLSDLEATCAEPEFAYWPKGTSVRRKS